MTRVNISFKQKREIYEHLKGILTKTDEGFWQYPPGQTDISVAKLFNVNTSHVYGVRMEEFGKVRAPQKASLEDRVRALESYLDELDAGWRQRALRLAAE